MAIKEIAFLCCFDSAENLRRVFSQWLGITPLEYRQHFRSDTVALA